MKEKNLEAKFVIISAALIICAVYLIFFLYGNLRGYKLYQEALSKNKPDINSEKIDYYREVIFLLDDAINLNKGNAEYLAKKADFIVAAIGEGLGNSLALDKNDAEDLYKKAISLSPVDFNYHSKLGELYLMSNDIKAQDEFLKAAKLYPGYYKVYSNLSRYYLSKGQNDLVFKNLFLAFQCYKNGPRNKVFSEIEKELAKSEFFTHAPVPPLGGAVRGFANERNPEIRETTAVRPVSFTFDERKRELKFIFSSPGAEFSLKEHGFPHTDIWLNIKVYLGKTTAQAGLYKDNLLVEYFKPEKTTPDYQIYTLQLDPSTIKAYWDELAIKVNPSLPLEKIEFILVITG